MKRWKIKHKRKKGDDIVSIVLKNRGLEKESDIKNFFNPPKPHTLSASDVGISQKELDKAIDRAVKAIKNNESIIVYTDYDADGVTGGAILWEALHELGVRVMPYVPSRTTEGYGFSEAGIDNVKKQFNPSLIISVDHGITAGEKIAYAKKLGIDVIVTDHHTLPENPPDALSIVHTTKLSGAGVAYFFAKELIKTLSQGQTFKGVTFKGDSDYVALAAIGTIADLVTLTGPNRAIARHGLAALSKTKRLGLTALFDVIGLEQELIESYHIGYMLGPRINAVGRIAHALDALRLLCTTDFDRAHNLASHLDNVNRQRQKLLESAATHARSQVDEQKKLLFIAHEDYNQGIIGLVAGRLMEEFYRPAIVLYKGKTTSKASARSISGFDITKVLRSLSDLLVDVGGHPMAAGFTVENDKLEILEARLLEIANKMLTDELLTAVVKIDTIVKLSELSLELFKRLQDFAPFGAGNPRPVFAAENVMVSDARLVGKDKNHLKLRLFQSDKQIDAIGFRMGVFYKQLSSDKPIDIAFTLSSNTWNGRTSSQLKIKDIKTG